MGTVFSCLVEEAFDNPDVNHIDHSVERHTSENLKPSSSFAPTSRKSSTLVIAIDFGTTYSGVAFSSGADFAGASLIDTLTVADKIEVVKTWPNQTNSYNDKTPTVLAYVKEPPIWGGNVKATDDPQVAYFKLGLEDDITRHYETRFGDNSMDGSLCGYLSDPSWRHSKLPNMNAKDHVVNFLGCLNEYVVKNVLPTRFGHQYLKNQKISYVITIPAIWSDKAKELTRKAAVKAGIKEDGLSLITEPEAAALYCATKCEQVDLNAGDRFMICDAGGGTVDLISYKVLELNPFKVEECTEGTGATCGAIYLEHGFEKLIKEKFERAGEPPLSGKHLAALLNEFNTKVKQQHHPIDRPDDEYYLTVPGIKTDIPSIELRDGLLRLTMTDLQAVFDPIFNEILELVKCQLDTVRDRDGVQIKTLFLVGGLGSNAYLRDFLRCALQKNRGLEVKQLGDGHTAIVRGAVLYKLGLDLVKNRFLRASYGTAILVPFQEGRHPSSRRVRGVDGKFYCKDVMHWFVKKGQSIEAGAVRESDFYSDFPKGSSSYNSVKELWICQKERLPEYLDSKDMNVHVRLTVDLRTVPEKAHVNGIGEFGPFSRVSYSLGLSFGAGGIELRLLSDGKVVGSVECEYI